MFQQNRSFHVHIIKKFNISHKNQKHFQIRDYTKKMILLKDLKFELDKD